MNTLRMVCYLCRIDCANFFAQAPVPAPPHPRNPAEPQKGYEKKWQKKKQKIPPPEPRWSHFYLGSCLAAALRTLNHKADPPQLLPIEDGLRVVLHLSARFHPLGRIEGFGQPPGQRLHSYLYFQIAWKRAARRRFNKYVKGPAPHIRMRPKRDYTRPNFLVLNNRKRRTIVCVRWSRQHQQERKPKPARKFSRTYEPTKHCLNQASTPPKS
jgi:hypothetical protein